MSTPIVQTDDAAVKAVMATLDNHIQAMMNAGQRVQDVNDEVQQHFKAACSTAYQGKIHDWQERYQQLKNAYQSFQGRFSAGHVQINNAHDQAFDVNNGWGGGGPGSEVYKGLNP
ncbi:MULTISPECIES: hypothetical protein [unclassified Kitasatospora]|uniref:hypothetical protein n=1 Tax=unclassified Kitasatospora TaxID=2633591 RepID=UPI002476D5BB|nr:hypothetical protein [Kitasatospora sp. MAA19]MDH6707806.1 uncharacterized protein YukE [Kitasatospora sp. MAA19]